MFIAPVGYPPIKPKNTGEKQLPGRRKNFCITGDVIPVSASQIPDFTANDESVINGNSDGIIISPQTDSPLRISSATAVRFAMSNIPESMTETVRNSFFELPFFLIFIDTNLFFVVLYLINMILMCYLWQQKHMFYRGVRMKRNKDEIVKKIAEEMQVPQSAMTDTFRIEFRGNSDVVIEGCKGLVEYEEASIKLNLGKIVVHFVGTGLEISSFFEEQAILKGTVAAVEFSS